MMRRVHKPRQKPGQWMVNGNLMNRGGKRKRSVRERNNSCMQRERKSGKISEKSINFHMIIKKISVQIRNIPQAVLVTRSVIFNDCTPPHNNMHKGKILTSSPGHSHIFNVVSPGHSHIFNVTTLKTRERLGDEARKI